MRLLRITTLQEPYLDYFYGKNMDLAGKPSADQLEVLYYDSYAQADSYTYYLSKLGYECRQVIANALPVQRAWCHETGVQFDQSNYISALPIEYAKRYKPDIVFINNFNVFDETWVKSLKAYCSSIRLVLGFCGIFPNSYDGLRGYDVVLTPVQYLAKGMEKAGVKTELLPHAFDSRILGRIDLKMTKCLPITFIGSVIRTNGFHKQRAVFLEELSEVADLKIFSENAIESPFKQLARIIGYDLLSRLRKAGVNDEKLAQFPIIGRYKGLKQRPLFSYYSSLRSKVHPPVYGLEMYNTLRRSQVTLNAHAECAGNSAGNLRLFEATGVGTCLLTDFKDDLHLLFEPDVEVATYKSIEEGHGKLRWLLAHPQQREEMAMAGMKRTLRSHTYENRANQLHEIIRHNLR